MKKLRVIITCLLAWLLVGCAATAEFAVRIRSVSDPARSAGRNYVLLPGDKDVSSDPQFGELAGYVRRTLAELDYREVETASADTIILLRYGLDPSSIDIKQLVRPALLNSNGVVPVAPAVAYGAATPLGPSHSITHAALPITPVTAVYRRWLLLEALDARSSEKVVLWKIAAVESGYYPDLKRLFPIMLAACKPFIGQTTKEEVVYLEEDDDEVSSIRGNSDP
jgi:hypothetical protein